MRLLDDLIDERPTVAASRAFPHLAVDRTEIHGLSCFDGGFHRGAQFSVTDLNAGTDDHARGPQACGLGEASGMRCFG